ARNSLLHTFKNVYKAASSLLGVPAKSRGLSEEMGENVYRPIRKVLVRSSGNSLSIVAKLEYNSMDFGDVYFDEVLDLTSKNKIDATELKIALQTALQNFNK